MKRTLVTLLTLLCHAVYGQQSIDQYFEGIRNNRAQLTAFFSQMPKGGDLHNHYSGSVYAETYVQTAIEKGFYLDTAALLMWDKKPAWCNSCSRFSWMDSSGRLPVFKDQVIAKWSCKDYNGVSLPSDLQFFNTFGYFNFASQQRFDSGLLELKRRALKEHVSYIETMFTGVPCGSLSSISSSYNNRLEQAQKNHDEEKTAMLLEDIYNQVLALNASACADTFNAFVEKLHYSLNMDDDRFTIRYQNYVARTRPPLDVFKSMVLSFISADKSSLITGVNIVAPENNDVSMRDYWLHMQMYRFLHLRFPRVKYAMHAGELALGMVKPEEMTWHINAAVHTAGASRIGHGVDLPYEKEPYKLLQYMAANKIAIEINLYSNEFILKVKDDEHPVTLYKEFKVPIVICTDDAGVLRSNLTHQYVLLATRYPGINYKDVKQFVYNSIDYSFIKEAGVKDKLKRKLDKDFEQFETTVLNRKQ